MIFKTRKAMKVEIANLNEQIRIQANESEKLRKANTDLNRLWQAERKCTKELETQLTDVRQQLRARGIEYAETLGQKNQDIELLNTQIREQQATIARLKAESTDANSGLASSVSELKAKLRDEKAKVKELKQLVAKKDAAIAKMKSKANQSHEPQA